jgi:hypothetical protein
MTSLNLVELAGASTGVAKVGATLAAFAMAFMCIGPFAMGCGESPLLGAEKRVRTPTSSAPPDASNDSRLPVPEAVTKLHQNAFNQKATEMKLGPVLCVVTLHDAPLRKGEFFPVVLFANGRVSTWRQTLNGGKGAFLATLTAEEQGRAASMIKAIPKNRSRARTAFDASAMVMGVSWRRDEGVESLYFALDEAPEPLSGLVRILKGRLEETNGKP